MLALPWARHAGPFFISEDQKMSRYERAPTWWPEDEQMLVLTDSDGKISYASQAFCKRCGYSEDQLKANSFSQLKHPSMPQGPLSDLWETLGRGDSWMGIVHNRKADGSDWWLDTFVSPIADAGGTVLEYQAIYWEPDSATIQRTQSVYQVRSKGRQPLSLRIPLLAPAVQHWLVSTLCLLPSLMFALTGQTAFAGPLFITGCLASFALMHWLNRPLTRLKKYCESIIRHPIKQLVYTGNAGPAGQVQLVLRLLEVRLEVMIARIRDSGTHVENNVLRANHLLQSGTHAAEKQLSSLSTVATSIEEFSASIQEVSTTTQNAAALSARNREAGEDSARAAAAAQESIANLVRELENSGRMMDKLDNRSQSIGHILDVIVSIAEQTNLLALNAAIEAARAGESGRGFAVVADEVRSLAQRTQKSTDEIQEMITELQRGSAMVVESIAKGSKQSALSQEQVSASVIALRSIVDGISENDGLNQQIATASEQQSQTVSQLNREIHDIHQLAVQTSQELHDTVKAGQSVGYHVERQQLLTRHLKAPRAHVGRSLRLMEDSS